jgi:hypothetical protein
VLRQPGDLSSAWIADINVDAPKLWSLFRDLCKGVLGPVATFIVGPNDTQDEDIVVVSGARDRLLGILDAHAYQLAHDGSFRFGLSCIRADRLDEVAVGPAKTVRVSMRDREHVVAILERHGLAVFDRLDFLSDFHCFIERSRLKAMTFENFLDLTQHVLDEVDRDPGLGLPQV